MHSPSEPRPGRGIFLMIAAITLLTVMAALVKAADRVPAGQAVFFRASMSLPVVVIWLAAMGQLADGLRTNSWTSHAKRAVIGSVAMGLGFAGLRYLPLPEVTALRFVTPILVVLFAAVMLGERIRLIRITAVTVGLAGVLVMLWPRLTFDTGDAALFGAALVLASAGLAALAQILIKSMTAREHTAAIVFYFLLTASFLSLLTLPFGWVWPTGWELVLLLGAGVVGGLGQILLTSSYRYADAGVLAPYTYVSMIWAVVIGYVVFAEVPTVPMLSGAALVIASGVAIWYRERQLGLRRAAEGKVGAKGLQ